MSLFLPWSGKKIWSGSWTKRSKSHQYPTLTTHPKWPRYTRKIAAWNHGIIGRPWFLYSELKMFQKTSGMVQSLLKQYLHLIACLVLLGSSHSADNYGYVHTIPDSFTWRHEKLSPVLYGHLSDMWLSTLKISAAQLRSVTEIAPPQPFLYVNRSPIWYDFHGGTQAIRYSVYTYPIYNSLVKSN